MKTQITGVILFLSLVVNAQQKNFLIEGQVVDLHGKAVQDVYIVNLNSHNKDISRENGVFSIWVSPSDSLVLSHISYFRKVVSVHSLLINPVVKIVSEDINIPEIRITSEQLSDYERADQNLQFLKEYDVLEFTKIDEETGPVQNIMIENNELMRSEASSISLIRFSPGDQLQTLYLKLKRKDPLTDYYSTKKVKQALTKEEETNK